MINQVFNSDCLPAMREMKDNQFDLAIVDPPYGIGIDKKASKNANVKFNKSATFCNDYGNKDWDSNIPTKEYFTELKRVSKNQIVWGANYFGLIGGYIYWDKCVTMPTYSDGELAYCSSIKGIKAISMAWNGMIQHDMKNKEVRVHPTQKPIKLYKWILKNYAKEGDTILDTHVGSGSSRIACWEMGFDFTGFEIDKDYWEAQEKRFKVVQDQLNLF